MSIQWMDNFGSYGLGNDSYTYLLSGTPYLFMSRDIASASGVVVDPADSTRVCLSVGQQNGNYDNADNQMYLPTPAAAVGVAQRFYSSGGATRSMVQWVDNGGNVLFRLYNELNGALSIWNSAAIPGFSGSRVATTTIPVITFNTWWHIEAMLDYVNGNIKVYVEGNLVLTYSFTPAPTTLIYGVGWSPRLGEGSPLGTNLKKDFVVYDNAGSINNTAGSIGPCTVYRLPLNSDVSNGWTVTGGTTVNGTVGGEPPADTTKYITAGQGPIPAAAICGITSLPNNIVGVRGIMSLQRVQKSDAGDANYQVDIVSGSSTHTGTTHSVPTSFSYQYDVVELDPATGAAWSPTSVNNLNIKINRTV